MRIARESKGFKGAEESGGEPGNKPAARRHLPLAAVRQWEMVHPSMAKDERQLVRAGASEGVDQYS